MKDLTYSAGGVKHAFWFPEFRKEISMLAEGKTTEEIKKLCLEDNLFGASTTARAKMVYLVIRQIKRCLIHHFIFGFSRVCAQ